MRSILVALFGNAAVAENAPGVTTKRIKPAIRLQIAGPRGAR